jgi:hypothetical protein
VALGNRTAALLGEPGPAAGGATNSAAGGPAEPPPRRAAADAARFGVRGGQLVKRGPGRSGGHYEHAVSREQLDQILVRLQALAGRAGARQKPFAVEDIERGLPEPLPRYKVYVVLSLVQRAGLLFAVRKGAYLFAAPEAFAAAAAGLWDRVQKQELV